MQWEDAIEVVRGWGHREVEVVLTSSLGTTSPHLWSRGVLDIAVDYLGSAQIVTCNLRRGGTLTGNFLLSSKEFKAADWFDVAESFIELRLGDARLTIGPTLDEEKDEQQEAEGPRIRGAEAPLP